MVAEFDPVPLRLTERVVTGGAIALGSMAIMLFIVVLVLGSGGSTTVPAVFGPVAIVVTAIGIVLGVTAAVRRRTRTLGVVALVILAPSVLLSLLTVVAISSRA